MIQSYKGPNQGTILVPSHIDDDNIASYYVSLGTDSGVVNEISVPAINSPTGSLTLKGPQGTRLSFDIKASLDLSTNNHLFTTLGGTGTALDSDTSLGQDYAYKFIDTNIRVTGATTGASIDIPVRFVKND